MRSFLEKMKDAIPWIVIGSAMAWSVFRIAPGSSHHVNTASDGIVISIGHYQLDPGVKEALDAMAREFAKIHPGVTISQEIIPSGAYPQWVSTQLISGKPVDILEQGTFPAPVRLAYAARYFVDMTPYVQRPNPFNKGTDLEKVKWCKTYWDSMQWSYSGELQSYTSIPLSKVGCRMFTNLDLLKKLTGRDSPPTNYRDFLEVCREIRRQKTPQGRPYTAIACSRYHWAHWEGNFSNYLTWPFVLVADYNMDGFSDSNEDYLAFQKGLLGFQSPCMKAKFGVLRDIAEQCQKGFTGLDRPEAILGFAQQNAVFISACSYEVTGLMEQARGCFRMVITDFPRVDREDPVYGAAALAPPIEIAGSLFQFCVSRSSPHVDLAIEFLQFLGSQKNNEKFNHLMEWIPAVIGTEPPELLKAFKPHVEGMYGGGDLFIGGESTVKWQQTYSLFQIGRLSYDDFAKQYTEFYKSARARDDFQEQQRNWRRGNSLAERTLTTMRERARHAAPEERDDLWGAYVSNTKTSRIREEIVRCRLYLCFLHPDRLSPNPVATYSPAALEAYRRFQKPAPVVAPNP